MLTTFFFLTVFFTTFQGVETPVATAADPYTSKQECLEAADRIEKALNASINPDEESAVKRIDVRCSQVPPQYN